MNRATLVRKSLFRKKVRASLLILSIAIAFFIFGALGAFYKAFNSGVEVAAADRLVTVNKINFTVTMPLAYQARVAQVEGVRNVSHASWFGGYYQEPQNFVQTFAVDPETYLIAYDELVVPPDQRAAFLADRTCLAAGRALANQYGWSLGDRIPLLSNIWQQQDGSSAWDFTICAIFDADDDAVPTNYAIFHYDYFNETLAFNRDQLGWLIVSTTDPALNAEVSQAIDALFANSPAETETTTEAAFTQAFLEQIGNIGLILTSVIGAAFATILMIVGTTMVLAVDERTKEIAVMKTLGFTAPSIFAMTLGEVFLLSLLGGLIGLGLAWTLVSLAAESLAGFIPGLGISLDIALIALALMVGLALLTGLLPAMRAMNVQISTALGKL